MDIQPGFELRLGEVNRVASHADEVGLVEHLSNEIGTRAEAVVLRQDRLAEELLHRPEKASHPDLLFGCERVADLGAVCSEPTIPEMQAVIWARKSHGLAVVVVIRSPSSRNPRSENPIGRERCAGKDCGEIVHEAERELMEQHLLDQSRAGSRSATDKKQRQPGVRCVPISPPLGDLEQHVQRSSYQAEEGFLHGEHGSWIAGANQAAGQANGIVKVGWDKSVKPASEQVRHESPIGIEDGSRTPASDARLGDSKLRFPASLRQAGPGARRALFWLRLFVGLTILYLILSRVDVGAAGLRPSRSLLAAIVGATGLWITSQAVAALRWKLILDDDTLPWIYLLRLYITGTFFGLFLPTSVGGDAVRAAASARSAEYGGRAIASVLLDRGFGVLATVGYAGLGLILAPHSLAILGRAVRWHVPALAVVGLGTLGAGVTLLILGRSKRVRRIWLDGLTCLQDLVRSPHRLLGVAGLAIVSQGLVVLLWYTLSRGMNFGLPVSTLLWAVPVVSLSALLPVTFAGLGVREGVWLILLAGSPIPPASIVAFSLLYFVCNVLVGITGGVLFVSMGLAVSPRHAS